MENVVFEINFEDWKDNLSCGNSMYKGDCVERMNEVGLRSFFLQRFVFKVDVWLVFGKLIGKQFFLLMRNFF